MSITGPKQQIFAHLAMIAAALSHAHRIEMLELLAQGEYSVEDLALRLDVPLANASRHLQVLRRARLAAPRRDGKRMLYSLVSEIEIVTLLAALGRVGERNIAEIQLVMQHYFRARDELEPISRADLFERLRVGSVTLLDVRPHVEFVQGHLPGALNITLDQINQALSRLGADQQIVAYCRGPYCVLSFQAVELLRAHGIRAVRLEDGFPEWKSAGLPIET